MVRNALDVPLAIEVGKYPAAQRRNLLPNPSPDWIEQKSRNKHPNERDRGRESQFRLKPLRNRIDSEIHSQNQPGDDRIEQLVRNDRSEEHTSELQSLMRISYAVFCLKKNKDIVCSILRQEIYTP